MQGAKDANNELFKAFCNDAEMEQNFEIGVLYLIILTYTITRQL
jgi:hypothetical protein